MSLYAINILNATHQQVGLLNSLPAIVSLITIIIGGYWFSSLKSKKKFVGLSILSARSFLLLIALIPFLPGYQAWALLILIGLMSIPGSLSGLSWQSFIGDLIPEQDRGQFFSNRNRILVIVSMISTGIIGIILNRFDQTNPYPFQLLFVFAFLFGVIEVYYLFKHIEIVDVTQQASKSYNLLSTLKESIKEKPFLYFLLSSMLFNFGWQMAWPLFSIYQIEYAHATAFWLSIFTLANQTSQILTYKWWGKMSERYGNSKMLFIAAVGMGSAPFLTVLSTNFIYLTLTNIFTGIFLAGTNLLLFNQLLGVAPEKQRSSYITIYSIFIGLIAFTAPQFGVWVFSKIGMNETMYLSSGIRVLGGFAFYIFSLKLAKLAK